MGVLAWLQGQLSMQTAVLSPDSMIMLMRVNMDPCHSQLDSMLEDTSSNGPEHWRLVAVCPPARPPPCCMLKLWEVCSLHITMWCTIKSKISPFLASRVWLSSHAMEFHSVTKLACLCNSHKFYGSVRKSLHLVA